MNTGPGSTPEEILARIGLPVPSPDRPAANYAPVIRSGSLLFLSGHGPYIDGQPAHMGKVGSDITTDRGRAAAERVTLNLLATLKGELGELSRISRIREVAGARERNA